MRGIVKPLFYSHVNYSVTKIAVYLLIYCYQFYSHVNYSVTKMGYMVTEKEEQFYSHVNYSVTKIHRQYSLCY